MSKYEQLTPAQSAAALHGPVRTAVDQGWRVLKVMADGSIVLVHGKQVNARRHMLLSIGTGGAWLVVWLLLYVFRALGRTFGTLSVAADGIPVWKEGLPVSPSD